MLRPIEKVRTEGVTITETDTVPTQDSIAENSIVATDTTKANSRIENTEEEKTSVFSGYGMGTYLFKYYKDMEAKDLKDSSFYALLCFTFILFISALLAFMSLKSKLRQVHYLAYMNIFLSLIAMFIFYLDSTLEVLSQIKFGYYLFLINTIAIIVLCKKAIKQNAI